MCADYADSALVWKGLWCLFRVVDGSTAALMKRRRKNVVGRRKEGSKKYVNNDGPNF